MPSPDRRKDSDSSCRIILMTMVHYNDQSAVSAYVEHLHSLSLPDGWRLDVAISDNSATWNHAPEKPIGVDIFRPGSNVGYLGGCAFALGQWRRANIVGPAWVGVTNTDLELETDFFLKLLKHEMPSDVGVVGPTVQTMAGTFQNPFMRERPSRTRMNRYLWIYRSNLRSRILDIAHHVKAAIRRALMRWKAPQTFGTTGDSISEIYAAHGSAVFLSNTFFDRGGVLNYRGFMYGEEIFLAEQARSIGVRVVWMPGLQLLHRAHAATGFADHLRRTGWLYESTRIAWEDHFSQR